PASAESTRGNAWACSGLSTIGDSTPSKSNARSARSGLLTIAANPALPAAVVGVGVTGSYLRRSRAARNVKRLLAGSGGSPGLLPMAIAVAAYARPVSALGGGRPGAL